MKTLQLSDPAYYVRMSTTEDFCSIKELIKLCFGVRESSTKNLDNRYFLVFEKTTDKLIALTGLTEKHSYGDGVEFDYTCTHPDYRGQGIITEVIGQLINIYKGPFWYSAWRLSGREQANAAPIMNKLGFRMVCFNSKCWSANRGTCDFTSSVCVEYRDYGFGCYCYEDLYMHP